MPNQTDYPIHDLLESRFSPRAFNSEPVPADEIRSLFEAARWAASSRNEQPWRFLVAPRQRPELFEAMVAGVNAKNQVWARTAGLLAAAMVMPTWQRTGGRNRYAWYDLGQAVASLTVEATSRDLYVHQMAGILPQAIRERFRVPDEIEIVSVLAVGRLADPEELPEDVPPRDLTRRSRRPQDDFVFAGEFGESW